MLDFIKDYAWALYLGIALGFLEVNVTDYKYWIVTIPLVLLVIYSKEVAIKKAKLDTLKELENKLKKDRRKWKQ